jgi:hypothetical protein
MVVGGDGKGRSGETFGGVEFGLGLGETGMLRGRVWVSTDGF